MRIIEVKVRTVSLLYLELISKPQTSLSQIALTEIEFALVEITRLVTTLTYEGQLRQRRALSVGLALLVKAHH